MVVGCCESPWAWEAEGIGSTWRRCGLKRYAAVGRLKEKKEQTLERERWRGKDKEEKAGPVTAQQLSILGIATPGREENSQSAEARKDAAQLKHLRGESECEQVAVSHV